MSFIASMIKMLPDAAAQGLIWGILAIGVFITYKLLDFSDLTVDGSICTGGAVAALNDRGNGGAENTRKIKGCTYLCALTGADEGFPLTVSEIFKQKQLYIGTRLIGFSYNSRGDNL